MKARILVRVNELTGERRYRPQYYGYGGVYGYMTKTWWGIDAYWNNKGEITLNGNGKSSTLVTSFTLAEAAQACELWMVENAWRDSHALNPDGTVELLYERDTT